MHISLKWWHHHMVGSLWETLGSWENESKKRNSHFRIMIKITWLQRLSKKGFKNSSGSQTMPWKNHYRRLINLTDNNIFISLHSFKVLLHALFHVMLVITQKRNIANWKIKAWVKRLTERCKINIRTKFEMKVSHFRSFILHIMLKDAFRWDLREVFRV